MGLVTWGIWASGLAFLSDLGNMGLPSYVIWGSWPCSRKKSGQSRLDFLGSLGNLGMLSQVIGAIWDLYDSLGQHLEVLQFYIRVTTLINLDICSD